MTSHRIRTCVFVAGVVLAPGFALAQGVVPSLTNGPIVKPRDQTEQKAPQPAAIPGAKPQGDAAPATQVPLDMPPTEALFDAINRGDMGSAKDAINRGADIFGRNILGMTPIDVSVDLGRNDITFLLLSMRGASAGELAPPPPQRGGKGAPPPRSARQVIEASATAPAPRGAKPVAMSPPLAPRQYAGDGGAPVPQAGFLGFGSATR